MDVFDQAVAKHPFGTFVLLSTVLGLAVFLRVKRGHRLRTFPQTSPNEFPETFHRITSIDGEVLVVPNKYLDELKNRPDSEISVLPAVVRKFDSEYTHLYPPEEDFKTVIGVAKVELTRKLAAINPQLSADVAQTIKSALPPSTEWAPVNVFQVILHAVAVISGGILVGRSLSRRPEYIHAAINYTVDVFRAAEELQGRPTLLKPFISYFSRVGAQVRKHRRDLTAMLAPAIAERKRLLAQGVELPEDALSWATRLATERGRADVSHVVNVVLYLMVASIHTTTGSLTRVLHDLAAMPDTVEELREEIRGVLKSHDGVLTPQALFDMKLTDSCMKESQRLQPILRVVFMRHTEKPITMKDGTHIPANTFLETPSTAMRDPSLYPEPDKFDPRRFLRLRADAADEVRRGAQYQFSSSTSQHVGFGAGRHSCPGRFFAANEIKLILAQVLLGWDVALPPGLGPEAFASVAMGAQNFPEMEREVLMRRVDMGVGAPGGGGGESE